jgi:hypothetical protein
MLGSASHHRLDRDYGSRVQHHRDTVEVAVKFGLDAAHSAHTGET